MGLGYLRKWHFGGAHLAEHLPLAIRDACRTPIRYRETLITDGLYRIWLKNKKG